MKKIVAIFVVGAACLLLAIQFMALVGPAAAREVEAACNGLRSASSSKTISQIPTKAPNFTVTDHQGKQVKLSDYRGKVVMVNFWASWCGTCEAEKPGLERLQRELGYDDFAVLALASDTSWGPIAEKLPDGSALKILLDPPKEEGGYGQVATSWGIKAVPESFLIDRDGTIRHYFVNKRDWDSSIAQTCIQAIIDE